jgi:prepilin-type processing-associated H-X9-DG protein
LRQIALGAQAFHDTHDYFPSSVFPSMPTLLPRAATLTLLLPYLEQRNLYEQYNQMASPADAANLPVTSQPLSLYQCPSSPNRSRLDGEAGTPAWRPQLAVADYSAVTGVDARLFVDGLVDVAGPGVLVPNAKVRFSDIHDGASTTVLYAESAGRPHVYRRRGQMNDDLLAARVNGGAWARPESDFAVDGFSKDGSIPTGAYAVNATNGDDIASATYPHAYYGAAGTGEVYSFHLGIANIAFADGSVRSIDEEIEIRHFARLVTRAAGEVIAAE